MRDILRSMYASMVKRYSYYMDIKISGCFLGNRIPSKYWEIGSYATQSTKYSVLRKVFPLMKLSENDVVVDVGCGKGRFIHYLLHKRVKAKIIGVEIDERVARFCSNHLPENSNVDIIVGNILEINIPDATIFYLFNPFDETVLASFINKIENATTRSIRIVYANPEHSYILQDNPKWHLENNVVIETFLNFYEPFRVEIWKFNYFHIL